MPAIAPRKPKIAGLETRIKNLVGILDRITDIPPGWVGEITGNNTPPPDEGLTPIHCETYAEVLAACEKAMLWSDGLDRGLTVSLACIMTTKMVGDQLWIKMIGPPSCGKTTLCDALSVDRKHVLPLSSLRGFHSGHVDDGDESETPKDNSLLLLTKGMTVITKDGDTLLTAPNLPQVLAEARDIYDGKSHTSYRNKAGYRAYTGLRLTWILCGTSALRLIDASELGERFLDVVIMESIDEELEELVNMAVADKAERALSMESDERAETQQDPAMTSMMQLTGGYVEYLRDNAVKIFNGIEFPAKEKLKCTKLGKFVSFMRARPSGKQEEFHEREFSARLVSQLVRLSKAIAGVRNKTQVDDEVMHIVTKVAFDTGRGSTMEIVKALHEAGKSGLETAGLAHHVTLPQEKIRTLTRFLKTLGVIESFSIKVKGVASAKHKWRLTPQMADLYKFVTGELK